MTDSKSDEKVQPISLAAAAEELGVHYMTAYRYIRTGRMLAEKRGGQWWVESTDLAAVKAEGTGPRRTETRRSASEPRPMPVGPFTARLVAGDTAGCWDLIVDALSSGATPVEIHQDLIGPALDAIGVGWTEGNYTIADEHRATATANRLIGQIGPMFRRRGRRRGSIVLGGIAGDPHSLPTAMMADVLSDRRFDVIDLGANTPTESFLDAVDSVDGLVGLGLSVSLQDLVPAALDQLGELRASLPDLLIVLGGSAVCGRAPRDFEQYGCVVSNDMDEACAAFELAATPVDPAQ